MDEAPLLRWCPGVLFHAGDVVLHDGRRWLALVDTSFPPSIGTGSWVRATLLPPQRRAVAALPHPKVPPRAAKPAGRAVLFPSSAESRERAAVLVADALKRAAADPAANGERIFRLDAAALDTLAASDAAIFAAADHESRERDCRLAEAIAELRRRIEAR